MKVIFMGTPDFAVTTLQAISQAGHEILLVVTQPDKPKGRGKNMQCPPVKEWAMEHNIPVFQPVKIREASCIEELRKYPAEIMIVAAFGQILPKEILEMPKYGCVNVHASLLPKYRGAAPIQWAVINGDPVSGVTTMQMGVGLDDGDMLLREEVTLAEDETGGSLFDKLAVVGGELCVRTMEGIEAGTITSIPQDESEATHVGMIKKSLGEINFQQSATEIERLVRGLNPWPSAFAHFRGKTLKIWKAAVVCENSSVEPGTVCFVDKDTLRIQAKEGCIDLLEVQLEGKKRMRIQDFLRGHEISEGEVLL